MNEVHGGSSGNDTDAAMELQNKGGVLREVIHFSIPSPHSLRRGSGCIQYGLFREHSPGVFVGGTDLSAGLRAEREIRRTSNGSTEIDLIFEACDTVTHTAPGQVIEIDLPYLSYVIAPGALYNGNRFLVSPQPYCPYLPTEGVTPHGPILMADVPRLCADSGYHTELAANALTTPHVGIFDAASERGVIISFDVYGDWGVTGIGITTLPGEPISISFTFPVMRQKRYRFCDWIEADEPCLTMKPGMPLRTRITVIPVQAAGIPAFNAALSRRAWETRDTAKRKKTFAWPQITEQVESKHDAHNWDETLGCYLTQLKCESEKPGGGWPLQTGWVGGGVTALAFLQSPNPLRRDRARRMLDLLATAGTNGGYFYGTYKNGAWMSFGAKRPGCRAFSLVRRPLELGRDLLKAGDIVRARGEIPNPAWERSAKACLDAVVDTVDRYGHLGYTVDPENGDVLWGDSTCGAFGIESLVRGFKRFGDQTYLETAKKLSAYYREHFLKKGYTCGGVGDALMAVDSESNYALLAGLVSLHEVTRDPLHLAWAVEAAELFQTWVLLYDAKLPADSPLGILGIESRGAVFANIQNQHGAPGICTSSGAAFRTLTEATGDDRWGALALEIAQCIPQMVVQEGHEDIWGDLPAGSVSERLMTMDGLKPCGHTAAISTWAEIALLLSARELMRLD